MFSLEGQTLYKCSVGILLYLVKHTRPDLANTTRELSKAMDVANYLHWRELLCVIVYALKTQEKGIVLKPDSKLVKINLKIMVDADFAGDQDNCKSIMGRIIYLNDAPVGWNSKAMNSVTLSSTKAEYVSMLEGLKDLKFIYMCLKYLKLKVNLPMLVLIDNIGAIKMLDLKTNKYRTKHVDTKYHWIRQFVDDDMVNVKYIKSEDNVSDICTKKLLAKLFEKHSDKLVSDVGLFTRCNRRLMGKGEPNPVDHWEKKDRLLEYKLPLGRLETWNNWNFTTKQWVPNTKRLRHLKKRTQGHDE